MGVAGFSCPDRPSGQPRMMREARIQQIDRGVANDWKRRTPAAHQLESRGRICPIADLCKPFLDGICHRVNSRASGAELVGTPLVLSTERHSGDTDRCNPKAALSRVLLSTERFDQQQRRETE